MECCLWGLMESNLRISLMILLKAPQQTFNRTAQGVCFWILCSLNSSWMVITANETVELESRHNEYDSLIKEIYKNQQ